MEECISDIQCNVALNCPGNQQYSTCHGCTVPCSDRDSPEPCPRICQIGCYCPPGTYLLGEQCVSRQQCETAQSCPGNQIYSTCAGCDVTCSQRNESLECAAVCRQQCTCPPNTYLQGDLCLTNEQCDAAAACPNNQVYSLCAGCDVSCADRNNPGPCTLQCRQQCTCPSGTYLYMEECISDIQCNVALNCPGNQQYSTCHGCTVPCSDRDSPEPCPRICQIGCYCPPGTYLLGEQCVSRQQCETAQSCPGNQIYSTCAGCDVTCSQRNESLECAAVCTPTMYMSS
ncbi:zonadhesin-like [Ciona intestinalis]